MAHFTCINQGPDGGGGGCLSACRHTGDGLRLTSRIQTSSINGFNRLAKGGWERGGLFSFLRVVDISARLNESNPIKAASGADFTMAFTGGQLGREAICLQSEVWPTLACERPACAAL